MPSNDLANVLQIHFDLFDANNIDEKHLQKKGILNAHLCINAQTKMKHTECDASYTTISVPPHEKEKTIQECTIKPSLN